MKLLTVFYAASLIAFVRSTQMDVKEGKLLKVLRKSAGYNSYENMRRYDRVYGPSYRSNYYYEPTTPAPLFAFLSPATTPIPYINGYPYGNRYGSRDSYQNNDQMYYQNANNGMYPNNYNDPMYRPDLYNRDDFLPYYLRTTPAPAFPFNLFPTTTTTTTTTPVPPAFPFNLFPTTTTTTTTPAPFPFNLFPTTTTQAPMPFPLNLLFPTTPKPFPFNLG